MAKMIDLIGRRFGRLTVIAIAPKTGSSRSIRWNCKCDCGNEHSSVSYSLLNGVTKECLSCAPKTRVKHGKYRSPEYIAWTSMKQRCSNEKNPAFRDYGGRGIIVCDRWRDSFEAFLGDMGERPSDSHSIDRIDNNGNYEPSNCRWTTSEVQQNNRRDNQFVECDGIKVTVTQLARRFGKDPQRIFDVIRKGVSAQEAALAIFVEHSS